MRPGSRREHPQSPLRDRALSNGGQSGNVWHGLSAFIPRYEQTLPHPGLANPKHCFSAPHISAYLFNRNISYLGRAARFRHIFARVSDRFPSLLLKILLAERSKSEKNLLGSKSLKSAVAIHQPIKQTYLAATKHRNVSLFDGSKFAYLSRMDGSMFSGIWNGNGNGDRGAQIASDREEGGQHDYYSRSRPFSLALFLTLRCWWHV